MKKKSKKQAVPSLDKIKRDIEELLNEGFFPSSSKEFLYGKIVPAYNKFFGNFSRYALDETKKAMSWMVNHERLYLITPEQFFPKLYKTLDSHYKSYTLNVKMRERRAKPEKEDVDSIFKDFEGNFKD